VIKLIIKSIIVNAVTTGVIPRVFLDVAAVISMIEFMLLVVSLGVAIAVIEVVGFELDSVIFGASDMVGMDMGDSVLTLPKLGILLVSPAKLVVTASVVVVRVSVTVKLPLIVVIRIVSVFKA
jgi:hypothetical protein